MRWRWPEARHRCGGLDKAISPNPSLIFSGITFFVVLGAVVAMVIEIKRLADQDVGAH